MSITVDKVRDIAKDARPNIESILNCNPINPKIGQELEKHGLEVREIKGTFSTRRSHVGGEPHLFLKVDPDMIESCTSPIIVDGAINQFCMENYDEGRVFEQIGPKEEIPTVAVLTPQNDLYSYFHEEENY